MNKREKLLKLLTDEEFALISMLQHFQLLNEIKGELKDEIFENLFNKTIDYLENKSSKILEQEI